MCQERPYSLRDQPPTSFSGFSAGLVKVCYLDINGTRVVVKLAGPGDIIGFADTVDSAGRHTQAFESEAVTKSSVALFTRDHVMRALHRLSP